MKSDHRILGLIVKMAMSCMSECRFVSLAVYVNWAENVTSGYVSNKNHLSPKILSV